VLQVLDRNRDGFLQQDEVPERVRLQIQWAASRRGLDPNKPIRLEQLTATPSTPATRPTDPQISEKAGSGDKSANTNDDEIVGAPADAAMESSPLVPGFGVPSTYPLVPGFGSQVAASGVAVDASGEDGESEANKRADAAPAPTDARLQRYARSLLIQYDRNKNGQLEREEWGRMRGNPQRADRNRDQVLTVDELAQHLATYADRRDSAKGTKSPGTGNQASSSFAKRGPRQPIRFLRPHERLPAGLPEWFVRKDTNGDGQVSMSEFSTSWTAGVREEFATADVNRDGFVVPSECLKGGQKP
jgi:hypothetical protein